MKGTTKTVWVLVLATLLAMPTFAQNASHRWGIGFGYALRDFSGIPQGELSNTDFSPAFRIQLGRYLGRSFDLALASSFRPQDNKSVEQLADLDLTLQYKFNNGYIFREDASLAPYLLAGIGMNVLDFSDFSPNAYAPLGVGLKLWGGEPVTIDLNAAYKVDLSGNLQDYFSVNAGVIFNFGKGVKAPAPEVIEVEELPSDRDNDGVADADDECPDVPGLASLAGCPDRDGDGIADHKDDCPDVAGLAAFNGCPDTDGDGIPDHEDKCPTVAGIAELMGCPEVAEEVKEKLEFATKAVQFETGSAVLKRTSYALLDTIVSIMNQYPEYSLRVSGHTDSVGDATKNQELSEKRAKACIDYLAGKGIDPNRLVSIGYGEAQPIADNINAAGRAQNRRVEFDLFVK